MSRATFATPVRVRDALGGYVATLRGQRATCSWSHKEAALRVAEKVFGAQVDVVSDYLTEGDAKAGIKYRYRVERYK